MFRYTINRCMHDSKIPNITRSHIMPVVSCSFDSPRKMDYHKPIKQETSIWRKLWPKYRVHSQQYREYYPGIYSGRIPHFFTADDIKKRNYKATRGDGTHITSWNKQPNMFDVENEKWMIDPERPKPHEHAEAEEEAIWGEINHDYTDLDGVEPELSGAALKSYKKLFKKKTT